MSEVKRLTQNTGYNTYNAGGTITKGDLVKFDGSGDVVVATTGVAVLGIARQDATSSDTVVVDEIDSSVELEFVVETGTAAAATVGDPADLASPDGLTLTNTNSDVTVIRFIDAATVVAVCNNTVK